MVLSDVWKNFGFNTVVYLAAITSIDPSLYEAAAVDGASRWKQTWHVTIPGMGMIIVLLMVLSLGGVLDAASSKFSTFIRRKFTNPEISSIRWFTAWV